MSTVVIEVATSPPTTPARTEYSSGHVVVEDNRIVAVGDGPGRGMITEGRRVDGAGCLLTPGFVNTHHHLYQWVTRGFAVDGTLFEWLTTLYPVWAKLDADIIRTAATGALASLATYRVHDRPPITTTSSRTTGETCSARRSTPRSTVGLRFHPTRGSMDLGQSQGRAAPGQRGRGHRHHPGRDRAGDRHLSRHVVRLDAADRGGAVLAVLGHRRTCSRQARLSWPGARGCGCTPTSARRSTRRHYCREHFNATPVEYMESRWAGSDPTSGTPTPSSSTTRPSPRWRRRAPAPRTARRPMPGWVRASPGCATCAMRASPWVWASTVPPRTSAARCGGGPARGAVRPGQAAARRR